MSEEKTAVASGASSTTVIAEANTTATTVETPLIQTFTASALKVFLFNESTQQRYLAASDRFKEARIKLLREQQSFANFKAKCASQGIVKSLQLNLVQRSLLPVVDGQPNFFSSTIDSLKELEKQTTEKIVDALTLAKEKYITHLRTHCNQHSFTIRESSDYETYVKDYAKEYVQRSGVAENFFPVQDAIKDFTNYLNEQIQLIINNEIKSEQEKKEKQQQDAINDAKAQESILAGASTGQSIIDLANRTVDKRLKEIENKFDQLHIAQGKQTKHVQFDSSSLTSGTSQSSQFNKKNHSMQRKSLYKDKRTTVLQDRAKQHRKHGMKQSHQPIKLERRKLEVVTKSQLQSKGNSHRGTVHTKGNDKAEVENKPVASTVSSATSTPRNSKDSTSNTTHLPSKSKSKNVQGAGLQQTSTFQPNHKRNAPQMTQQVNTHQRHSSHKKQKYQPQLRNEKSTNPPSSQ
ncbi:MAG TPA: hypothetical protein VHA52_13805 [Candidatus Babeliaceae bacterium]|nr:hypothetical protein [Candidatus Babeliaceae bacterium]